jgi:hypothetical protein
MKLFRLEKWYFDFLTPNREFVFCYLGHFDLINNSVTRFNLSIAHPDGSPGVSYQHPLKIERQTTGAASRFIETDHGTVSIRLCECRLHLTFPNVLVNLRYQADLPGRFQPLFISRNRKNKITWFPLMMPGRVSGQVMLNDSEINISNLGGYIDYLSSDVFPLQTPVRFLYWGRFLNPACTLTYTVAQGINRQWTELIIKMEDTTYALTDLALEVMEEALSPESGLRYPKVYRLKGTKNGERATITVTNLKSAIEASFFDSEAGLSRRFFEYISKNPKGIKFFARADITLERAGSRFQLLDVPGISEFVQFRRR